MNINTIGVSEAKINPKIDLENSIHSFERTKQGTRRQRRKARRKELQQAQFRHQKKRENMVFFLLLEISEENCETD